MMSKKMQETVIRNQRQVDILLQKIQALPLDGTMTVILKPTDKSPTAKQRRLQWKWNDEVAESGIGGDDDAKAVHIRAKYKFGLPILMAENELFGVVWESFSNTVQPSANYGLYVHDFTDQYIKTERMTRAQRAKYMRNFQQYWCREGVNLTDPDLYGLNKHLSGS